MKIKRCEGVYEPEDDSFLLMNLSGIKGSVLEIGSGTGIVGLKYAEDGCNVIMVDISTLATKCSKENALMNNLDVEVIKGDMFAAINGRFDYCLFNPPYLPEDGNDDISWTGGKLGSEKTEEFLTSFKQFCNVGFFIESSYSKIQRKRFRNLKFKDIEVLEYDYEELKSVRVE